MQQQNRTGNPGDIKVDLTLRLPNDTDYDMHGQLDFADTQIEQGMGTVELRASFPNSSGIILPGLFVTLITESQEKGTVAMVPQAAVQASQQGKFVLVVDKSNTVKQRHVVLGRRINAMWVVEEGLDASEQVIIEGLQKVRPGVIVNPIVKTVDALTGTIAEMILEQAENDKASVTSEK